MDFETILVERKDNIGVLTLNRPEAMNAVCGEMVVEIANALNDFDADDSIRCVVVKGLDNCFAAGTDMTEIGGDFDVDVYADSMIKISNFSKPLICGVSGLAFGGGLELALCGDIVIAGDNAMFGFPEITIGTMPLMGGVSMLTKRVGSAKAADLLMTARQFSADEALNMNIVSRVVPAEEVFVQVMETAQRISKMPRKAILGIKQILKSVYPSATMADFAIAKNALVSAEAVEGINALREERAPKFD